METYAFLNAMSKPMNNFKFHKFIIQIVSAVLVAGAPMLHAQAPDNKITVPLTDPSRPVTLRAHLLNGGITVKGADIKEVIVEARVRDHEGHRDESKAEGMKRIPMISTGLNIEAENNQVRVSADSVQRTIDLTITVPVHTSLSLHTVNDGNINVTGVDGELDVNDVNGEVTLKNISGSAVAHALNGKMLVTFNRIDPQKPMAFSSMNGAIDVTFPADLKATVSLRTHKAFSRCRLHNTCPSKKRQECRKNSLNQRGCAITSGSFDSAPIRFIGQAFPRRCAQDDKLSRTSQRRNPYFLFAFVIASSTCSASFSDLNSGLRRSRNPGVRIKFTPCWLIRSIKRAALARFPTISSISSKLSASEALRSV